ncbi:MULTISPECIES: TonB-dependent receptor [unclassified Azospirillum]|uniref:TonB-dependent receptor n=1 Tax=unclassified Azospirillum TaxID=2630922 RepID=UPI000B6E0FD1|nr:MULTISPECIES: TonB-dependent receptor [unclassified Azospirillum]SNT19818.1 TonB-dependent receptor [Azospirillum sp. RU38E]SNT31785.1 TonB-dependent receptor [Azospirillum sp. RU37A]
MRERSHHHHYAAKALLLATCLAGAAGTMAQAQTARVSGSGDELEEIVVTGFRNSLANSTNAKRDATGFQDSIFAEDIGKFPDTNIAESFNRVPGITISREVSGEGLNIAIRGLGTNFTRVLLNGAPVAVASTGRTDSQNTNREVDLDMFPTELFSQLTVSKSPNAGMVEGGAAGTVNMRSARPFDAAGPRVNYSIQGTKNSNADKWGGRGSALASNTWGKFGALIGVAAVRNQVSTPGFETIGWTNANLTAAQCGGASHCVTTAGNTSIGGNNWSIPGTIPANAGNGLTPGATLDRAALLALNPGLTLQQIDNALIPRLGRPAEVFGTRDRINSIVALELNATEDLHFYVDGMYGKKKNDLERVDMNWVGRNGAMIPLNMKVDRTDCSAGCVVTEGTFANAQFFLEYRPFLEDTEFYGINPGFDYQITDNLKLDMQVNYTKSKFHRESPTVGPLTPASSGVTVTYKNDGGIPSIVPNIDLNDPKQFAWTGGRVNMQDERRETETKGVRGNLTWGEETLNLRVGGAYDDVTRRISAYDNSQAWQNAVCGNNPSVFLPNPNTQPPCTGLNQAGATPPAGFPTYPGYGTGFSAGGAPITYGGSLIPSSALANYLRPGKFGFLTVDWEKFKADSKYDQFHDNTPEAGSSNTGASGGFIGEKTLGAYGEVNGIREVDGNDLRFNIGMRWVRTDQEVGGRVSLPDPRNARPDLPGGQLPDGARYPNVNNFVYISNKYDNWLPSASAAYNVSDHAVVRAALSKTMTRPDPNAQLPGLNFSGPSADVGTVGNSALEPYLSENIDLGFEYYTGREGYIGIAAFRKSITGFTVNGSTTVPFSALAQYGVTYDSLSATQQAAINARGGPNTATVVLQQQVNADGRLKVNGLEFNWVQPLDFLLEDIVPGLGFLANATIIDQKGSGAAPAVAIGVADYTYNVTAYYEHGGISARISQTFTKGSQSSGSNQNGIPAAALFSDDYRQWDFSSSFDLDALTGYKGLPQITFDVTNLTKSKQRSYYQFENATFTQYEPGRTITIGMRGRF